MKSLREIKFDWNSGGGLLWTVMAVDFTHYILQLLESKGTTQNTNLFLFFMTTVPQQLLTNIIFLHISLGRLVDISAEGGTGAGLVYQFLVLSVNRRFIFLVSGGSACHLLDKHDPFLLLAGDIVFLSLM